MRVVHRDELGERIVDLEIGESAATVRDLMAALHGSGVDVDGVAAGGVAVDDVWLAADSPLPAAAICEGSVLSLVPGPTGPTPTARALSIIGGARAGVAHPFATGGTLSVGRSPPSDVVLDDPDVAELHFTLAGDRIRRPDPGAPVVVGGRELPAGQAAPLLLDEVISVGSSRLTVRLVVDDRPLAVVERLGVSGGLIPFNRPPRRAPAVDPPELAMPVELDPEEPAEPLSWAGIVLPVLMGLVVAIVWSPLFALLAALGPVLTIGTWWERRRRVRRRRRRSEEELDAALVRLEAALPGLRDDETRRLRELDPDPAEVVRRAGGPSVRCWERRGGDPDFLRVGVGVSDTPYAPALVAERKGAVSCRAAALVGTGPPLRDVPVSVVLSAGQVVGVVGDVESAAALGRAILTQLATHHGPADLVLAVAADEPRRWAWVNWLPHARDPLTARRGATVLATDDRGGADRVAALAGGRPVVALIEGADPFQGRGTAGRRLVRVDAAAAIVLVTDPHRLPAGCTTLVHVDGSGVIEVGDPRGPGSGTRGLVWGVGPEVAEVAARRLARLDDPELPQQAAGVPASVSLAHALSLPEVTAAAIEERWTRTRGTADLSSVLGVHQRGPLTIDLVADGPHVLIGGTTGSGKSELLRSFVAGLAANADPDHVTMVLVDYKGGAAFDSCADLPHVVGVVTDLDQELAARALRCLEAELRHRERRLRDVGADDLAAFRAHPAGTPAEPLPRLVVVVDEFASLAADLPDFLDALVGIAQRGRSLGVHLILATQRPAGVVTDDIRANAGCRVALRVTDPHDSIDVIDAPDAATIPRSRPGRGFVRFGPDELVSFQAPHAGGSSRAGPPVGVQMVPEAGSADPATTGPTVPDADPSSSDLRRLVDAVREADERRGGVPPRTPWPPPLPLAVTRADLDDDDGEGWLLVDEPDEQRRGMAGWSPADGHLVVIGGPRSGTTTTLATAALAAVRAERGDGPHLHVIDLDGGRLAPLARLPFTGAVIGPTDRDRRCRLLRWLDNEVQRRRGSDEPAPVMVLVIDDLDGLARNHDPVRERDVHERLERIWAEGPAAGVVVAVSVRRVAELPAPFAATAGLTLLHHTVDPADGLRLGVTTSTEGFGPGRVIRCSDGAVAQVVMAAESLGAAVAALADDVAPPAVSPRATPTLPDRIPAGSVQPEVHLGEDGLSLAVAVRDEDVAVSTLRLGAGDHALVLGPSASGRTNTLEVIARACPDRTVVVGGGELADRLGVVAVEPAALGEWIGVGPRLVLVDDCTEVSDDGGRLAGLVAASPPGVHVVAAARPDRLRAAFGHWAAGLTGSRRGLLLRPDPLDGDLLGAVLPARLELPPLPGRGMLVADGRAEVVQVVAAQSAE